MDWIDLAQDMGKWRSVVNTVTSLVPQHREFLHWHSKLLTSHLYQATTTRAR